MSPQEYYELLYWQQDMYLRLFEFWITTTFAYLVAIHFGIGKGGKSLYNILLLLYFSNSILLTIRFAISAFGVRRIRIDMIANGIAEHPARGAQWEGNLVFWGTILIMIVGTLSAIYYSLRHRSST